MKIIGRKIQHLVHPLQDVREKRGQVFIVVFLRVFEVGFVELRQ